MNVEDNMHDENMNEIFSHWSFEEIRYYSNIMWQQPKFLEEVQDMLRQPGTEKDLNQQSKKLTFEGYNKAKNMKQFKGYRIWKKRRRKPNLIEVIFFFKF